MSQYGKVTNSGGRIEDFYDILELLESAEESWIDSGKMEASDAKYMVVGGMAIQAHQKAQKSPGSVRESRDIDILIDSDFRDYFTGFLNQRVTNNNCSIESYTVKRDKGILYIITTDMMRKNIRASLYSGEFKNAELNDELYERVDVQENLGINVIKPEYLVASKISGYSSKRPKDGKDTMTMVDVIRQREKASKGRWRFNFNKLHKALETLYPTNSLESKELLEEFTKAYNQSVR